MKANRIVFVVLPVAVMIGTMFAMTGIETWLAGWERPKRQGLLLGG